MQTVIQVPKKEWARIIRILDKLDSEVEQPITEKEAAQYMGLELTSFRNLYYANKLPVDAIQKNVSGKRYYLKSKLVKPVI